MNKSLARRLSNLEKATATENRIIVLLYEEFKGKYYVDGKELTKKQFQEMKSAFLTSDEIIEIEILCNAKGTDFCKGACHDADECAARQDADYRFKVYHGKKKEAEAKKGEKPSDNSTLPE